MCHASVKFLISSFHQQRLMSQINFLFTSFLVMSCLPTPMGFFLFFSFFSSSYFFCVCKSMVEQTVISQALYFLILGCNENQTYRHDTKATCEFDCSVIKCCGKWIGSKPFPHIQDLRAAIQSCSFYVHLTEI